MPELRKIVAEPGSKEDTVTLSLNGTLSEANLPELVQNIATARIAHRQVEIDLSEVTLLDRKAVAFLSNPEEGVCLINCPAYLRRWIQDGSR